MAYCAIRDCSSNQRTTPNINFHRFPANKKVCERWIEVCKNKNINVENARVCSLHFGSSDYKRHLKYELLHLPVPRRLKVLKDDAFPTRKIPTLEDLPNQEIKLEFQNSDENASNMPSTSTGTSTRTSASLALPGAASMHPEMGEESMFDDEEESQIDIKEEAIDYENYIDMNLISKTESTLKSSEELSTFTTPNDKEKNSSLSSVSSSSSSSSLVSDPLHINESSTVKFKSHDEYHMFGMFVASQLRALSLQDALQAQVEIQTILRKKRLNSIKKDK